jgi:2-polyprenyl-3-methyl-5-hydroxy-6-metoxy-1,4-benzoquinol methylase
MNIHRIYQTFQTYFRTKRMTDFEKDFGLSDKTTILDVGGSDYNWGLINQEPQVTIINIHYPEGGMSKVAKPNLKFKIGDGTQLEYPDKHFDIVYSNSVIEHLYTYENQKKFADETMRTGKSVYVQTPAAEFFMEPHLITPFIHWLPASWESRLIKNFSVWGILTRPTRKECDDFLAERRLLNYKEFKELFKDCDIQREKFLFFTKSYIAVKK